MSPNCATRAVNRRRSPSISVTSISVASTSWCRKDSIPIAPTSSAQHQLAAEAEAVKQSIVRHTLELGLRDYSRAELESLKAAGERIHIKVVGLARIAPDVTPELALATIESITVLGALQASTELKSALAERIR